MRLLLDTHTFLWFIGGDAALSSYARQLIEDRTNERLLSIASLWEIAIKVSLGRLTVPFPFTDLVVEHVYGNAIEIFGTVPHHLDILTTLPFYHKDPFDRLIIAQGQVEDIPIQSRDPAFDDYAVRRLWT